MLSLIASLLVLLGAFSAIAQPQSQYSASSVKYSDGGFLQEKNDRRCSWFFLEGDSDAAEGTYDLVTDGRFKFRDESIFEVPLKTLTQIGTDWAGGEADRIELVYAPSDNLAGTFICRWTTNIYLWVFEPNLPAPVSVSLGVAAGASCNVDAGDMLTENYIVAGIDKVWMTATGASRVVLADGDRMCLMAKAPTPMTTVMTGFTLECEEQSIMGDGTTCYH